MAIELTEREAYLLYEAVQRMKNDASEAMALVAPDGGARQAIDSYWDELDAMGRKLNKYY